MKINIAKHRDEHADHREVVLVQYGELGQVQRSQLRLQFDAASTV